MIELINQLQCLQQSELSINDELRCGILNPVDALTKRTMIKEKERSTIKELALKVHVTDSGKPRKITYQESKGLWYTILPGKKKIYSTSEDGLYEKIVESYGLYSFGNTFSYVFRCALKEKRDTENPKEATLDKYKQNYKKFITKELASQEVEKITRQDLMAYTQKMVKTLHPKKKAYLEY
nr:hypothetical protein [Lachnospiraceae bacterium]